MSDIAKQTKRLNELIAVIKETTNAAGRWSKALIEIAEKELYLLHAPTMTQFCVKNFGWSLPLAEGRWKAAKEWAGRKLIAETTGEKPSDDKRPSSSEEDRKPDRQPNEPPEEDKEDLPPARTLPKAGSDEPEVIKDATGYRVPKAALDYWQRRDEIQGMMTVVSRQKSLIENGKREDDPLFRPVSQAAIDHLSRAYQFLSGALPFAVCLECQGKAELTKCTTCKGTGLVCKTKYLVVSAVEKRKIREKAYKLEPL